ncbi:MAG: tRNA (adenosine(37)-N6)-threonylcarbamoyltransferase complex transferase subunit TsaD [Patescibacteria group bacterium]|nr:tRNA (adenosine(37)-N6)-threonylcarbamoyltransferase complex transferase subunit TsaD [Patescibacteria group bacterium]
MKILAIETSCDETAAALLEAKGNNFKLHSNIVASQIDLHAKTGGIVPEVAAREHTTKIIPVIKEAVKDLKKIDILAVTAGPGLVTSLIIGVETAKTLAFALNKPLVAVNHMAGHLYANWLPSDRHSQIANHKSHVLNFKLPKIKFPAICLIISGGHTEIILMKNEYHYKKIGQTLDDAAGEAFDKVAKLLGLGYPGGPIIEKMAKEGNSDKYNLPRPMMDKKNYDFSFSGLKTAVLYLVKDQKNINLKFKKDLAASFQKACFDVLIGKTLKAAKEYKVNTIMVSGGVAANQTLAKQFKKRTKNIKLYIPPLKFCTDNAAMIALAGWFQAQKKNFTKIEKIKADPNWELK